MRGPSGEETRSSSSTSSSATRRPSAASRSMGSGFIINSNGYIVTNNHVVEGATEIRSSCRTGASSPAKVVGRDPKTDLALLKVEATGLPVDPARRLVGS